MKFFVVAISWIKTPVHPPLIDAVLGLYGDWIRVGPGTWVLYSDQGIREIAGHIARILTAEDFSLVFEVTPDAQHMWGFAPQWVWVWMSQRFGSNLPAGDLPPPRLP